MTIVLQSGPNTQPGFIVIPEAVPFPVAETT